jgi:4-nitrophenyl phosphatase
MMETFQRTAQQILPNIRALIVDLDGVVHVGKTAVDGLEAFLAFAEKRGIELVYVTNNSTKTPQDLRRRLETFGVFAREERILTSALATARYLEKHYSRGAVMYPIGEQGLIEALESSGFQVGDDHPRAVVVGLDRDITYEKIRVGASAVLAGAQFVACNVDSGAPYENGINPGAGAMVAAVEAVCQISPTVIGKPEPAIFEQAVERFSLEKEACAVIGDRLDVDIQCARRAGLKSIFVLSGMDSFELLADSPHRPDMVFQDVKELSDRWDRILDRARIE